MEDADAKNAEVLAKAKRRVFTGIPTTPYDAGDLWVTSLTHNGIIKVCKTSRASGSYNADDWAEPLKYTDDTLANKIQNDLNNLSIGGRNLILNSTGNLGNNKYWGNLVLDTTKTLDGCNSFKLTRTNYASGNPRYQGSQGISLSRLTLRPDDYLTLSGWIYVDSSVTLSSSGNDIALRNFKSGSDFEDLCSYNYTNIVKDTWTKFSVTSKATKQSLQDCSLLISIKQNGLIYVSKLKLERGNRSTDWSPAPEDTETYVDNLVADLQEQVDGKIETWSQSSDPSTAWKTTDLKNKHTGDIWYNTSTKETKRWSGTAWILLQNKEAQDASALAQKKAQVFTGTPKIPYYKGDLWITSTTAGKGVVKTCITTRTSGSYTASDWVENLKYTDDTKANAAQSTANQAKTDAATAQSTANAAKTSAQTANNAIADITSDSRLTPSEKQQLDMQMQDIITEKITYIAQAKTYGVSYSNYETKYNTLYNYCYGTSGILANLTTTTNVNASTLKTNFNNYFTARDTLLQGIVNKTKLYTDTVGDSITVGGTNLAQLSRTFGAMAELGTTDDTWILNKSENDFSTISITKTLTGWKECRMLIYPKYGSLTSKVTVSFEYKSDTANLLAFNFGSYNGNKRVTELTNWIVDSAFKQISTNGDWKYVSLTFDPTSLNGSDTANSYRIQFKANSSINGNAYVRKVKLEIGNKATTWSPAPEDWDVLISDVYDLISSGDTNVIQTAEAYTRTELGKITSHVEETYLTKSQFGSFQDKYSSDLQQTSKDITAQFTEQITAEMGDYYEFKETVQTNIRFSSDGIEIGKSNSPFKSKFSNEKLSFLQNDNEVAYISNNQMYIANGEILNTFKIGKFVFMPRSNGNMSLKYSN